MPDKQHPLTGDNTELGRAETIRARAKRLKAELKAQHDAAPDDFLRGVPDDDCHAPVNERAKQSSDEALQLQENALTLRAHADMLERRAIDVTAQAREELAKVVAPSHKHKRKRRSGMVIVEMPQYDEASVERARQSADPDAVAREAVTQERVERTEPAKQSREARGAETKSRVGELSPVVKAEKPG